MAVKGQGITSASTYAVQTSNDGLMMINLIPFIHAM